MSEHTKEPWNHSGDEVKTADGNLIAVTLLGTSLIENQDNARRIVACVNACAGVHDNYLNAVSEEGGAAKFFKEREIFKQQRDELLAALKEIAGVNWHFSMSQKIAREAIAKVESEK